LRLRISPRIHLSGSTSTFQLRMGALAPWLTPVLGKVIVHARDVWKRHDLFDPHGTITLTPSAV